MKGSGWRGCTHLQSNAVPPSFLRYFVLLNTLIPISLVVSLEVIKVIQSYYIMNDANMVTHMPIEHTSANVA